MQPPSMRRAGVGQAGGASKVCLHRVPHFGTLAKRTTRDRHGGQCIPSPLRAGAFQGRPWIVHGPCPHPPATWARAQGSEGRCRGEVPRVMLFTMQRPRSTRIPAGLLAVMMALAVFLPEASHSVAHRDGAAHPSGHHEHHAGAPSAELAFSAPDAGGGGHWHSDFRATLPGKSLLKHALVARVLIRLHRDLADTRRPPAAPLANVAPLPSHHGPPPPTRAPPLV